MKELLSVHPSGSNHYRTDMVCQIVNLTSFLSQLSFNIAGPDATLLRSYVTGLEVQHERLSIWLSRIHLAQNVFQHLAVVVFRQHFNADVSLGPFVARDTLQAQLF